jgi:signal transduction histidine kinase
MLQLLSQENLQQVHKTITQLHPTANTKFSLGEATLLKRIAKTINKQKQANNQAYSYLKKKTQTPAKWLLERGHLL